MPTFGVSERDLLAYRDAGSADPAILLIHGWQADATVWEPVADRLSAAHRVISVDLRGAGASAEAAGPYTVERFSADIAALARALGLGHVVAVGHSMGGAIAQRLAVDEPSLVAGLVLVAPVPASGLPMSERMQSFFRTIPTDPATAEKWLRMLTAAPLPRERFDVIARASAANRPTAALEALESWTRADFAAEASTISAPTLVIAGACDRPQSPDFLRATVLDVIQGSRMTVVEDAGHYVMLEQDARVAELIDEFVRRLE